MALDLYYWLAILTGDQDRVAAYSECLARTLHHSPRAPVLEHIRGLSRIFLEALEIVKVADSEGSKVTDSDKGREREVLMISTLIGGEPGYIGI